LNFLLGSFYSLFFLMLFLPTKYLSIKAPLLALVLMILALKLVLKKKVYISKPVLIWCCVFILAGFIFTLWGITNGSIYALKTGKVDVLWPILFTFFMMAQLTNKVMGDFLKVITVTSAAIGLYSALCILALKGYFPMSINALHLGQSIDRNSFAIAKYYSDQLPVLSFTFPFLVTLYKYKQDIILRRWILASILLSLIPIIMSGRNALWLITLLSPIITFTLLQFAKGNSADYNKLHIQWKLLMTLIGVACFSLIQSVISFDFSALIKKFRLGFSFNTDPSAMLRKEQFYSLLNGWLQSPLIGKGLGTSATLIRSTTAPWSYELTYMSRLFHTGLLGVIIYGSLYGWIFYTGLKIARRNPSSGVYIMPLLAGLAGMLIANATNPYIGAFDYMWITFLPLAFINGLMVNKE